MRIFFFNEIKAVLIRDCLLRYQEWMLKGKVDAVAV